MFESTGQAMESINRRTWRAGDTLRWFARFEGFLDRGEEACFAAVAEASRGHPILDLGVGGGRTTTLLLQLSEDYIAIDYTPEMVAICRRKFPGRRIEEGDARDLSRFADGSFQLVTFSYNGIDAVDSEGRTQVLREVFRVLRPGGMFFFSSINEHGPDFRGPPRSNRSLVLSSNPVRMARRLASFLIGQVVGRVRLARNRRFETHTEGHAVLLHQAHDFGILVYATTLAELRAQLAAAGFLPDPMIVGPESGAAVANAGGASEPYFQIIARKPL